MHTVTAFSGMWHNYKPSFGFEDSHQSIERRGWRKKSSIENRFHKQRTSMTNKSFCCCCWTATVVLWTPSKFTVMRLVFDWYDIEKWIDELMWQYKSVHCANASTAVVSIYYVCHVNHTVDGRLVTMSRFSYAIIFYFRLMTPFFFKMMKTWCYPI